MIEQRPSVLLVDDDKKTIELLAAVLETQGFDTTLAGAPEVAVQLLRRSRSTRSSRTSSSTASRRAASSSPRRATSSRRPSSCS
jgi:CheY-like chemotaxis protein